MDRSVSSSSHTRRLAGYALPPRGFTLVEMLVVVAVMMILMALLLSVISKSNEAKKRTLAARQVSEIVVAAKNYYENYSVYPPDDGNYGNGDTLMDQWTLHKYLGSKVTNPADNTVHEPFLNIHPMFLKPPTTGTAPDEYMIFVDPWLQPYHIDCFHTVVVDADKGDFKRVGNPYDPSVIDEDQKLDLKVWSSGPDMQSGQGSHAIAQTGLDLDNITSW